MQWIGACVGALLAGIAREETADFGVPIPSLKEGGYVIVLRHGATNAEQEDIYPLNYDDTTKQRQLSEQGKEVALRVGSATLAYDKETIQRAESLCEHSS